MVTQKHQFTLFADYFQFFLMDDKIQPEIPTDVTDQDVQRHIKVAPNIVVVYPARNMTVPVQVEVHNSEPPQELDAWDHVTECCIDVPSGKLVILGCTDYLPDAARIQVSPGCYQVRVSHGGLATIRGNGLDGDDYYSVVLWPGKPRDVAVLKRAKYYEVRDTPEI
jgi:hypothetical protein